MDTCICMTESLVCLPETVTTLLMGYTPIQNKKFNKCNSHTSSLVLIAVWVWPSPRQRRWSTTDETKQTFWGPKGRIFCYMPFINSSAWSNLNQASFTVSRAAEVSPGGRCVYTARGKAAGAVSVWTTVAIATADKTNLPLCWHRTRRKAAQSGQRVLSHSRGVCLLLGSAMAHVSFLVLCLV